jgi:ferredoxin
VTSGKGDEDESERKTNAHAGSGRKRSADGDRAVSWARLPAASSRAEREFSFCEISRYASAVPRVTFEPFGVTVDCAEGESVFACARRHNVPIPTACSGQATCGLCRVKVVAGEAHLDAIGHDEVKHLGNTYFITKLRLSCQIRPRGDVTVRIPDARLTKLPKL